MRESEKLLGNTAVLGVASMIAKGISFLFMPFLTSYLSPGELGVAEVVANTALILLPFASFYAPETLFRFLASEGEGKTVVTASVTLAALGVLLFLLLFPLTFLVPFLRGYRLALLFYVLAALLHSFFSHWLRARGNYRAYAVQQIATTALTVLLQAVLLGVFELGTLGYLFAIAAGDTLVGGVLLFLLRPWRYVKLGSAQRRDVGRMARYALPLMPTAAVFLVTSLSNRYFLLYYQGEAATGIYAAAGRIPALFTLLISVFLEAWHYSAVSFREGRRARIFARTYRLLLPLSGMLCGGFMLVAPFLVRLLLHDDYEGAAMPLLFLLAGAFCSALSSFLGSAYHVKLRSGECLFTALLGAAFSVTLNFLLIPRFFLLGAALASFLSYLVMLLLRLYRVGKLFCVKLSGGSTVRVVLLLLFAASSLAVHVWWGALLSLALIAISFWRELLEAMRVLLSFLIKFKKRQKEAGDIDNS